MKAEITFSQLYWNNSLMNFFFRGQSITSVDELLSRAADPKDAIDKVDEYASIYDIDLEEMEEIFYSDLTEELSERFGIELKDNIKEDEI